MEVPELHELSNQSKFFGAHAAALQLMLGVHRSELSYNEYMSQPEPIILNETQDERAVSVCNQRARSNRLLAGLPENNGLEVVIGDFIGRTELREYLQNLQNRRYVLSKLKWVFVETFTEDHDIVGHLDRLPEIHPETSDAIASFATLAIGYMDNGIEEAGKKMGSILDRFLSKDALRDPATARHFVHLFADAHYFIHEDELKERFPYREEYGLYLANLQTQYEALVRANPAAEQ